VMGLYTSWQ